jgi:phosphoribosylformylglycinamidine cyclo-ligase
LIGIASNGLHSNGYSLARKLVFDCMGLSIDSELTGTGCVVADVLLTPTRIYVRSILNLIKNFSINGIAHITGGGLLENIPRILPKGCQAVIHLNSWEPPVLFDILRDAGNVEREEMYRTFNMGIGMVLAVPDNQAEEVIDRLSGLGEKASIIGEVTVCKVGKERVELVEE